MAALETPYAQFGWKASPFSLKGTDGKIHTLESARGPNGLLVMFICNHCPYVKAILDRLVADVKMLQDKGIGCIAIMANDPAEYPEDSFDNMRALAESKKFTFPYVIDETQGVARAYDAVCTPDFFGFDKDMQLQYRGRLDESWSGAIPNPKRELLEAMLDVATSGTCTKDQNPSIGCSIKWNKQQKTA